MPYFRRPGAISQARWMCKLLYSLKIVILSTEIEKQLPPNYIFTAEQLQKLIRFVHFCVFIFVKWWMCCPLASKAPANDLLLIQQIAEFKTIDEEIAKCALKAFAAHQ